MCKSYAGYLVKFLKLAEDSAVSQQMTSLLNTMDGFFWTLFGYGSPREWYPIDNCQEQFYLQEAVSLKC